MMLVQSVVKVSTQRKYYCSLGETPDICVDHIWVIPEAEQMCQLEVWLMHMCKWSSETGKCCQIVLLQYSF